MEIKIGDFYIHSKSGNKYKVITLGKNSDTLEDLVVYEAQYQHEFCQVWVRPLSEFLEEVEINGQKVPRFKLISG
jgi:hypothetical protein